MMKARGTTGFGAAAVWLIAGGLAASCLQGAESPRALHVNKTGRYFEADGKPWFWLGDTAWPLLVSYTAEEADAYLEARAKLGFTIVQMSAIWDGGTGTEKGPSPNPNYAGVTPWRGGDPLQPEEAYWKNVDAVVASAARHGLYVGLLPAWGSYVVNRKMLVASNAEQYGRWLGERYKNAANIVWIVGGDRKVSEAPDIWKQIGRGLQAGDGGAHPITFHPGGERRASSDALTGEPWLAANMIQTWANYADIPGIVRHDYELTPPKPVILGESAYEEGPEYPTRPITPLVVRKQAYWAYLSGGFFTYGHNDMWRKNPSWRQSLTSPGARNMSVLKKVFSGVQWWHLVPDQTLLAGDEGSGTTANTAARDTEGHWILAYVSQAGKVHVKTGTLQGKQVRAEWINPADGTRRKAAQDVESGGWATPEGWEDALLLLKGMH